ncbi:hypothetical protein niasHS_016992 [Heterodera schachtii]|uniref:Uncharacterized protein n=1 Tax=Heterodera schachtii TaxID=97005 RepID=A0ABD2HZC1_HETSC
MGVSIPTGGLRVIWGSHPSPIPSTRPPSLRHHSEPPIHARSSPSPPPTMPILPRADTLLERRLGGGWWLHPEGRRLAESFLRENWLRHSINGQLVNWDRLDSVPAQERRVQPHLSVADHWRTVRETPLRRPELPAVIQERGVRGTSRRSIARQRRTGIPTWLRGAPHFDFFPLEALEVEPPDPIYRAPTLAPPLITPLRMRTMDQFRSTAVSNDSPYPRRPIRTRHKPSFLHRQPQDGQRRSRPREEIAEREWKIRVRERSRR